MTKWIIEAPVWRGNHLQQNDKVLAALHGPYADPTPWYVAYNDARHWFYTEPDARAWVEARVMEAMGATVHDPNAEWNAAIEAAAMLIEQNAIASNGDLDPRRDGDIAGIGYAAAIRALKRGGGDE